MNTSRELLPPQTVPERSLTRHHRRRHPSTCSSHSARIVENSEKGIGTAIRAGNRL
jgi:hypothetical protein